MESYTHRLLVNEWNFVDKEYEEENLKLKEFNGQIPEL